jgi:hypothetical protein
MNAQATLYWRSFSVVLLAILLLAGCNQVSTRAPLDPGDTRPAPTVSSAFSPISVPTPQLLRATTRPVAVPTRTADQERAAAEARGQGLTEVPVYTDRLSEQWSLDNSYQMAIDLRNRRTVDSGEYALEAKPSFGTGTLYFTLKPGAGKAIERDKVQALRFRLSGGDNIIDNDSIAVAIVGSNTQPYWRENDTSVQVDGRTTDGGPVFSETRLVFLGVKKSIPAGEWVDVEVWLDELLYDPDYTYVTGFYLKTDRQEVPVLYIDYVSLLMTGGESAAAP